MNPILHIEMDNEGEVTLNYVNDERKLSAILYLAGQNNPMLRTGILSAAMNMLSVQNPEVQKDFVRQMQELSRDRDGNKGQGKPKITS